MEDWPKSGMRELSGVMEMFYTFDEVMVTGVYSFSKLFKPYAWILCIFLYVPYISKKKKNGKQDLILILYW